ncbi:hypothetical protein Lalb_Chr19g0128381 [Lupinus albus]|uniref:Uncharacterized protein n=1 Tax=Lupinus albus TaxID=3870 RepID=A0A6A4NYC2_LUPAL|nr:hypothetical protein Lalb_Chr19g0128381 [Lupinus albus]
MVSRSDFWLYDFLRITTTSIFIQKCRKIFWPDHIGTWIFASRFGSRIRTKECINTLSARYKRYPSLNFMSYLYFTII